MYTLDFDENESDITTGNLDASNSKINKVKWCGFNFPLPDYLQVGVQESVEKEEKTKSNSRVCFIVNSESFEEFLNNIAEIEPR